MCPERFAIPRLVFQDILGPFQLHDDTGETLTQGIVDLARQAISLLHDRRTFPLLGELRDLQRQGDVRGYTNKGRTRRRGIVQPAPSTPAQNRDSVSARQQALGGCATREQTSRMRPAPFSHVRRSEFGVSHWLWPTRQSAPGGAFPILRARAVASLPSFGVLGFP